MLLTVTPTGRPSWLATLHRTAMADMNTPAPPADDTPEALDTALAELDATPAPEPTPEPVATEPERTEPAGLASLMELTEREAELVRLLAELDARVEDAGGVVTEEDELEEQQLLDQLDDLQAGVAQKLDRYGFLYRDTEERAAVVKARLAPVTALQKSLQGRVNVHLAKLERLKGRVAVHLAVTQASQAQGERFTWALQANGGALGFAYFVPPVFEPDAERQLVTDATDQRVLQVIPEQYTRVVVDEGAVAEAFQEAVERATQAADQYAENLKGQVDADTGKPYLAKKRKALAADFQAAALDSYLPAWLRPRDRGHHVRLR